MRRCNKTDSDHFIDEGNLHVSSREHKDMEQNAES
jgi:hypothetical protein